MSGRADTASGLADAVRTRRIAARDVVAGALARVRAGDGAIGAFLHVAAEEADAAADAADRSEERDRLPLAGVPVAVKDNLLTVDAPTTAGSRILEGFRPRHDATAVRRLRAAGAIVLGKTNLDEFGMGSSTENSAYFPTRNPWNRARVPGGSSGGSAAAVAAGFVPAALGSDTGGSIRQPAALCGVYGLKPTYGRVSRFGLIAYASSLDTVGCFARTVDDLELVYRAIAAPDDRDATGASFAPDHVPGASSPLRVGFDATLLARAGVERDVAARIREAADALAAEGAALHPVRLPDPDPAVAAYYVIATAEASSNLARYDGVRYGFRAANAALDAMMAETRDRGFGREVKRRILLGTYALSAGYRDAFYVRALAARRRVRDEMVALFEEVDLLLLPTSPTTAFPLGERAADPVAMMTADVFTVAVNLAGLPGLSAPVGSDGSGLPIGAQLVAPWGAEASLFAAARRLARRWPEPDAAPAGDAR